MLVAVADVTVAMIPLNFTSVPPVESTRLAPLMVTVCPTEPLFAERPEMVGTGAGD
jgi:hypothetical protein